MVKPQWMKIRAEVKFYTAHHIQKWRRKALHSVLRATFAIFAVKDLQGLHRKGRKEKPQRSPRKTTAIAEESD
jgi:hypothetical protein